MVRLRVGDRIEAGVRLIERFCAKVRCRVRFKFQARVRAKDSDRV